MRYRRSSSIVLKAVKNSFYCYNFLLKKGLSLSEEDLILIKGMEEWVDEDYFLSYYAQSTIQTIARKIYFLSDKGIIVKEYTPEEQKDSQYKQLWKWGENAALYHFSIRNTKFVSEENAARVYKHLEEKVEKDPSPLTFHENRTKYETVYVYEKPNFEKGIFSIMKRRRTIRSFNPNQPISEEELMNSLFAGLGIVGFREAPPIGLLPLKMTPSGGARNPYDAFVYCQRVGGLTKGIYHYSPTEHSLGLVNTENLPSPGDMLGSQPWLDEAAAVVFLVANIDRTMWKYEHHTGYRVVLIEAGHIGQNIILAANEMGFYGSPTAATCDNEIDAVLHNGSDLFKSCTYAIALGHLGKNKNLYAQ